MNGWDFGLFNSLNESFKKNGINIKLFPVPIPYEVANDEEVYLAVEISNIQHSFNQHAKANISISLNDNNAYSNLHIAVLKAINEMSKQSLELKHGKQVIGNACLKIESVENRQKKLSINMQSLMFLKRIYIEDETDE